MRKSTETFRQLCDFLVTEPSYKMAALDLRVSEATIFRWLQESQQTPSAYEFEWGGHIAPLHIHVRSSMKMQAHLVESQARKLALDGWDTPVYFGGKQQFVECELKAQCPGDLDWYAMVDGCRDPYKRDADGNRIPLTVKQRPSDALIIAVLKAYMPKTYGTNVEHNVNHSGGVLVIGAPKGAKPVTAEAKALPVPAEDRLAVIRERMKAEAEAHLNAPGRITQPNAPIEKFSGVDAEIHDRPMAVSRAPQPAQPSQPPNAPQPHSPPYARHAAPGNGVQGTGFGPDPANVGGSRGFNMNPPQRSGPRRII